MTTTNGAGNGQPQAPSEITVVPSEPVVSAAGRLLILSRELGLDKYPNLHIEDGKIRCRDCNGSVTARIFTDEEAELYIVGENGHTALAREASSKDVLDCETVYVCQCDAPGHHPNTDLRFYRLNADAIKRD